MQRRKPRSRLTAETASAASPGSRSVDILVFFGVLLVGFAYLWKRGDLDWVRSSGGGRAHAEPTRPAAGAASRPTILRANSVGAGT